MSSLSPSVLEKIKLRYDKKCGKSGIPDDHICHLDQPATTKYRNSGSGGATELRSSSKIELDPNLLKIAMTGAVGLAAGAALGFIAGEVRGHYAMEGGAEDRINSYKQKAEKEFEQKSAAIERKYTSEIEQLTKEAQERQAKAVSAKEAEVMGMRDRDLADRMAQLERDKDDAIANARAEAERKAQEQLVAERQQFTEERAQIQNDYEQRLRKASNPKSRRNRAGDTVLQTGVGVNLTASLVHGKKVATADNPKGGIDKATLDERLMEGARTLYGEEYDKATQKLAVDFRQATKRILDDDKVEDKWSALQQVFDRQLEREKHLDQTANEAWTIASESYKRALNQIDISSTASLEQSAKVFDLIAKDAHSRIRGSMSKAVKHSKNQIRFDSKDSCPPGKHWVEDPRVEGGGYCRKSQGGKKSKSASPKTKSPVASNRRISSRNARNIAISTGAAVALTGAGVATYLGVNRNENRNRQHIPADRIKNKLYKQVMQFDPDKLIGESKFVPDKLKEKARKLTGLAKRQLVANITKQEGGVRLKDINVENNTLMYQMGDGSLRSITAINAHVMTFESLKDKNQIEGLDNFEMVFDVDASFSQNKVSRTDALGLIRAAKSTFKSHVEALPENCMLTTNPFDENTSAKEKKGNIYVRNGFRELEYGDGMLWAGKQGGKFVKVPEDYEDYLDFARDLSEGWNFDSIKRYLTDKEQCPKGEHWVSQKK